MPGLDVRKYMREKHLTDKGKHITKVVDQPCKKLVVRLKDNNSKINYIYNYELRNLQNKKI